MWIDVTQQLPEMNPGKLSDPVFVLTGEFWQDKHVAVARCWVSTQARSEPKWYLDNLWSIVEIVTHWQPIPQFKKEKENV